MPPKASKKILCLCLGVLVTLSVYGYQFGQGNHCVYLLDALTKADSTLLRHDWFTTQTLQYHVAFTWLTTPLMKLGVVEPAFLMLYLALVVLFHIAWRGIVEHLGGDELAYLMSVLLYYLSAAGTGLGMYNFFQDSSLLPGNIAAVALLCGIWLWLNDKTTWSSACFGIAGLFHLNFALVGVVLWMLLTLWKPRGRSWSITGALSALIPAFSNIVLAARSKLARSGAMPLDQFIDLYVRLRHPHHYDPSTWPAVIWIGTAVWIVAGLVLLRGQLRRVMNFLCVLIGVALLSAGVWFFSETLVQMSLYRFSMYVQLLGCSAFAVWFERMLNRKRMAAVVGVGGCTAMIAVCAIRGPYFGVFRLPRAEPEYIAMCQWVSRNTPVDSVVLVPPDEEVMRLTGKRAIVVNFKAVPQLSAELVEWRQRLCDVVAIDDLRQLPHGYLQTLADMRRRHDELSAEQIRQISQKYGARYLIRSQPLPELEAQRVDSGATGRFILYDLRHGGGLSHP